MSVKSRRDAQTQSTVESIKMASASVLGTTTGLGYPMGSAMGAGNMLEQHSETVSMIITPLIFKIRDTLISSEGLELLSIEWNLERPPGQGILPEQLLVAGGTEGGVGSLACILSWEKGAIDPFKIDQYVKDLSKKLADIESAVINNELNYELEGLPIIQRFANRLNSVLFVDLLDRRFKGSWDSLQIKETQTAIEAIAKMVTSDDFTLIPPSSKITQRKSLEFRLPPEEKENFLDHFQDRVLTPSAIEMLTKAAPETGQAILSELNTYAYAIEEADIAEGVISVLNEYLQRNSLRLSELQSIKGKIADFIGHLNVTVDSIDYIVEQHLNSGLNLSVLKHKDVLLSSIDADTERFNGIQQQLAHVLIHCFMKSVERESTGEVEIRAWQLRSTLSYAVAYARKVAEYFSQELDLYLINSAARKAFFTALRDFRQEAIHDGMDSTGLMLFEKFYNEVYSHIHALFSRRSYQGTQYHDFVHLMESITREIIESFKNIDVWNLIDFSDVAEIARSEVRKKYADPLNTETLSPDGAALMELLDEFQTTVSDIIPDVADTILSKPLIRKMIERMKAGSTFGDELSSLIETIGEKSEAWRKEAISWVKGFQESMTPGQPTAESLLVLLQYIHELLREVVSPSAMADRVKIEADARESAYKRKLDEWKSLCNEIEQENESIRQRCARREELIAEATRQFEAEMSIYERAIREYQEAIEQRRSMAATADEQGLALPDQPPEPVRPAPLEIRVQTIIRNNPYEQENTLPSQPLPEPTLHHYIELRDLLFHKLTEMKEREMGMEETFAKRILRLQTEGVQASGEVEISIGNEFLQHLMDSRIRGLGKLLSRISRIILRNPKKPDLLYLVSYEYYRDELTVTVGRTYLR